MLELTFPVEGPLRFPMLVMEWIFTILAFDLAVIFVLKYRRQERGQKQMQELGFASLFAGFGAMWLFYIIGDYFSSNVVEVPFLLWSQGSPRVFFTNIAYMWSIFGVFGLIVIMEQYRRYLFKRRFFSIIYGVPIPLYIWLFFVDMDLARSAMNYFVILFTLFMILFLVDLGKNIERRKGGTAMPVLIATFIALFSGYFFTFDITMELLGEGIRILGSTMQLVAFVAFFLVFIRLPPLSSLDWKKLIDFVYVFDKGGMCMVQRAYLERSTKVDDNLVSSALSTVGSILEEMTHTSRGISAIKKSGKVITMYSSELVNGAIIGNEENEFVARNLKNFIDTFESIYRGDITRWGGETDTFEHVQGWMDSIFS